MTPRIAIAFLLTMLALPAAGQQAADSGAAAFSRRDFAAAARLWQEEAAAGSARAKLGLGQINDLGLGVPRDAAKALRWYLEAAGNGLAEAQFNVAVMLDAGTGAPRDVVAAAVWYARAAANGHRRAQYNLGLLYESGQGAPRNEDLAQYWLGLAAETLPAAEERLATLAATEDAERRLAAPEPLAGEVIAGGGATRAELVWSASPEPQGALFLVEVARLPLGYATAGDVVWQASTEASAVALDLPRDSAAYAWRVSVVDAQAARYAAAPWQRLTAAPEENETVEMPSGRVTLLVAAVDATAAHLASELAERFAIAGLWTRIEPVQDRATETSVTYFYREDAELAAKIAAFLSVRASQAASRGGGAPGEFVVSYAGSP